MITLTLLIGMINAKVEKEDGMIRDIAKKTMLIMNVVITTVTTILSITEMLIRPITMSQVKFLVKTYGPKAK